MKKFFAAILLTTNVFAAEWALDSSHSSINFNVDHLVISETTGKFTDYKIQVEATKPDFTDAKFSVTIKTASIDTADAKRDEHLRSADFFDVQKHPEITFQGSRLERTKDGKYKVHGVLTMNGVKKEYAFDAKFGGIVKDPWGGTRAGLKLSGTIDRYDFGLKYNSVLEAGGLAIGKEVRIVANVELLKK